MFVEKSENDRLAKNFWLGKPSGRLMWALDANTSNVAKQAGYVNNTEFYQKELGTLIWGTGVNPTKNINHYVDVLESKQDDILERKYTCPNGVLTQQLKEGQIIKHKVATCDELKILIDIWENTQIESDTELYEKVKNADTGKWPIYLSSNSPSCIQHIVQHETGVENFWYLLMDSPSLVEKAMEIWQDIQQRKYDIMVKLACDGFYQAENTSTTMISPEYYQKYSLKHMKQFSNAANKAGVRSLVHMCGLLQSLMPLLNQTGMNGIHSLSPAPIGNTSFEYAYQIMPRDFFALGRFGSLHWIGRTKQQIMDDLAMILPHHIYKEQAFILLVTADVADFTLEDLYRVRDCIEEYEKENK